MAFCKKCGNKYLGKECLICKEKEWNKKLNRNVSNILEKNNIKRTYKKENISEKDKLYKTIRYAIIFFIAFLIIGTIIDIIITNYFINSATPIIKNMNEMSYDIMKENKKFMKQLGKSFEIPNQNR